MSILRFCRFDEMSAIHEIINAAAEAYRGVIPPDRWHDPYMPLQELHSEILAGVTFCGYEHDGDLVGIMGIQQRCDVDLIRHAYVRPGNQRHGVGAALLGHLRKLSSRRMLVGTWTSATWAISFYHRHGFDLVSSEQKAMLLRTYWTIPERQIETSVVLANSPVARGT